MHATTTAPTPLIVLKTRLLSHTPLEALLYGCGRCAGLHFDLTGTNRVVDKIVEKCHLKNTSGLKYFSGRLLGGKVWTHTDSYGCNNVSTLNKLKCL